MNRIEEAISEYWGPRCQDFNPKCHICQAWAEYDTLIQHDSSKHGFFCCQCSSKLSYDGNHFYCAKCDKKV